MEFYFLSALCTGTKNNKESGKRNRRTKRRRLSPRKAGLSLNADVERRCAPLNGASCFAIELPCGAQPRRPTIRWSAWPPKHVARRAVLGGPRSARPVRPEYKMRPKKIKKLKGILCRDHSGEAFLRTTKANGTFRDYQIYHSDLSVIIEDDDAFLYQKNGNWIIDHSPATLGIDKVKDKPIKPRSRLKSCT